MFQHAVDWTVDPLRTEHMLLAAQREADKRAAAHQSAAVIEPLAPIDLARHEHTVDPALEDGRRREPEDRKDHHEQVAPKELVELGADVGTERAGVEPVPLLERIRAVIAIGAIAKVGRRGHRLKAHGIQIRHLDGGQPQFDQILDRLAETSDWLVAQWRAGAWIAANCTGTFILAQTGLLDGRTVTTTWWLERQFRARYPKVDLQIRSVITESDRLVCAGASASYLLQAIRIIERFSGPTIASQAAKSLLIDVSQTSQVPYLPLLAERAHSDSLVERAQHWLQSNMTKELRISELAEALAVSDRTLIRRFKATLGQTPLAYLQDLRLEAARALLETGDLSVEVIGGQVGYNDTSSFSRLFRQRIGMTPGAYRSRFQINSAP